MRKKIKEDLEDLLDDMYNSELYTAKQMVDREIRRSEKSISQGTEKRR